MHRYRIVGAGVTGQYTIALVRWMSDDEACKLAHESRGRARAMIPTDLSEIVTYRESFAINGMATNQIEIGRIPA